MLAEITDPLALAGKQNEYDVSVRVSGGGLAGQVDAIKLALSKALTTEMADLRPVFEEGYFLKRDPREKNARNTVYVPLAKRAVLKALICQTSPQNGARPRRLHFTTPIHRICAIMDTMLPRALSDTIGSPRPSSWGWCSHRRTLRLFLYSKTALVSAKISPSLASLHDGASNLPCHLCSNRRRRRGFRIL